MKRIISIILALTLIATFSITAFADETETGSITINGISTDNTYEIYKLLDLESYDVAAGAYSYKANAAWAAFFTTDEAKLYMATDKDGYVTWIATEDDDTKATFAKLALAYAQEKGIAATKSTTADPAEYTVSVGFQNCLNKIGNVLIVFHDEDFELVIPHFLFPPFPVRTGIPHRPGFCFLPRFRRRVL